MKKYLYFVSLFFLNFLFSQNGFYDGSITTKEGIEFEGQIEYKNWNLNPLSILFKNKEGQILNLLPTDIKSFRVKGEEYESAFVEIETSPTSLHMLEIGSKFNIKKDFVFLQVVYRGEKSLYFLHDQNQKKNFYIKINDVFQLLYFKTYLTDDEKERKIHENKKFIGQLTYYLSDCNTIDKIVKDVKYTNSSLEKVFEEYYKCVNKISNFSREVEKTSFIYGFGVGINNTSFSKINSSYLPSMKFESKMLPTFLIFGEFQVGRNFMSLSLREELQYFTLNSSSNYENYINSNQYSMYEASLRSSFLKWNNIVKYNVYNRNYKVFLQAGVFLNYNLNSSNQITERKFFYSSQNTTSGAFFQNQKFSFGPIIGTGFSFDKYSIDLRYDTSNNLIGDRYSKLINSNLNLVFLYSLK